MAWMNDYFSFSKRERVGVLILIVLIIIIYFLPEFFPRPKRSLDARAIAEIKKQISELKKIDPDTSERIAAINWNENYQSVDKSSVELRKQAMLFNFDPNTLSAEGWKKLGISDRTITTIGKYISKGGKFRKPEDLQKIFGLRKAQYEQLLPFVSIKNNHEKKQDQEIHSNTPAYNQRSVYSHAIIDINAADTSMLIALPGIGTKLANRILHFRDRLGGFYSIDQVKETFGLPDSTFQKIKPFLRCDDLGVQKININMADVERLKNHPYIKWNIANAIINYRQQHGDYTFLEELLKIDIISSETFQRVAPYLKVN